MQNDAVQDDGVVVEHADDGVGEVVDEEQGEDEEDHDLVIISEWIVVD